MEAEENENNEIIRVPRGGNIAGTGWFGLPSGAACLNWFCGVRTEIFKVGNNNVLYLFKTLLCKKNLGVLLCKKNHTFFYFYENLPNFKILKHSYLITKKTAPNFNIINKNCLLDAKVAQLLNYQLAKKNIEMYC